MFPDMKKLLICQDRKQGQCITADSEPFQIYLECHLYIPELIKDE